MDDDTTSIVEYVTIGLAVGGFVLVLASLFVESVNIWGETIDLLLSGEGVIVAGFALLTLRTLFDDGAWWYPPLFLVTTGNFIQTYVGPTDSDPLETVGFGVTLVGCAALLFLAWQRKDVASAVD